MAAGLLGAGPARSDDRAAQAGDGAAAAAEAAEAAATTDADRARSERLELGGHVAANVLLAGPPRAEWIAEAGGSTPPTDFAWPLDGGKLARGFGTGWRGRHRALDLMAERGTTIRAAARGLVAYSAWGVRGYGGLVMLVHPGGWVTLYAHASELLVRPGHVVRRGEPIARVGHTGNANGDHVHFELRRGGEKTDPAPLLVNLPAGVTVPRGPPLTDATFLWRVRRGQTLRFIARRAGVTVESIRALNDIPPDGRLERGRRIIVPRRPPDPVAKNRNATSRARARARARTRARTRARARSRR